MTEMELGRCEQWLFDIAARLRRVPFGEKTMGLHLRSLALKRALSRLREGDAGAPRGASVIDELAALDGELSRAERRWKAA